jgi:hypothetical protein
MGKNEGGRLEGIALSTIRNRLRSEDEHEHEGRGRFSPCVRNACMFNPRCDREV